MWLFHSEIWGPVAHTRSQVLKFGEAKYILERQHFLLIGLKQFFSSPPWLRACPDKLPAPLKVTVVAFLPHALIELRHLDR